MSMVERKPQIDPFKRPPYESFRYGNPVLVPMPPPDSRPINPDPTRPPKSVRT